MWLSFAAVHEKMNFLTLSMPRFLAHLGKKMKSLFCLFIIWPADFSGGTVTES